MERINKVIEKFKNEHLSGEVVIHFSGGSLIKLNSSINEIIAFDLERKMKDFKDNFEWAHDYE
ncbi:MULTISPECIES: hypothetical protein [unclassified Halobacteriovorax]|uniref:hypothetical protein n=1 Tax=unclassified Halobacteriovorax TaxID=2639665 RepID=UPI00399A37B8